MNKISVPRKQTKFKHLNSTTIEHTQIITRCVYIVNTGRITIGNCFVKSSGYTGSSKTNKECGVWLGDKAEIILMSMFDHVERMPNGNPGYDFTCGKGYRIDAKSGCLRKHNPNTWRFGINRNKIADYFLCLALDNRQDLNPLHVWLIPGKDINHLSGATISKSTLSKWSEYEQPLNTVLSCCNTMKNPY